MEVHPTLRRQLAWWLVPAGWAALITLVSSVPGTRLPSPPVWSSDKLIHGVVYAVLGALLILPLHKLRLVSSPTRMVLVAAIAASLFGVSDEWHQSMVPQRCADGFDALADTVGALLGAIIAVRLARRRS